MSFATSLSLSLLYGLVSNLCSLNSIKYVNIKIGGITLNIDRLMHCDKEYEAYIISNLENYITDELMDSHYYEKLSHIAPSSVAKDLLLSFSEDEKNHAKLFGQMYYYLRGSSYTPKTGYIRIDDYKESIIQKMNDEIKDYEEYSKQYLNAPTTEWQNVFFVVRDTEAQHAMRLPSLLEPFFEQ